MNTTTQLFCIPYAGGSASVFRKWKFLIDSHIEIVPLELAGKGARFSDPLYESLQEAAKDLANQIMAYTGTKPYALFGHSMGGLIVFEIMQLLQESGVRLPSCIFLSGVCPPHCRLETNLHLLSDEDFWQEIEQLGGTPSELLNQPELLKVLTPAIKQDFKMVERYKVTQNASCDVPTIVMYGKNEKKANGNQFIEWSNYLGSSPALAEFSGGHFFIHENLPTVLNFLDEQMKGLTAPNHL